MKMQNRSEHQQKQQNPCQCNKKTRISICFSRTKKKDLNFSVDAAEEINSGGCKDVN